MDTILIMARALSEASYRQIIRLDIQYNSITELYSGYVDLVDPEEESIPLRFEICENGEVSKMY